MSAYLLNLTFDQAAAASASGLFVSNNSDATSKMWYTVPSSWPTTEPVQSSQVQQGVPQNFQGWGTPVADSHSLVCNLCDGAYIRVAPRSGWSNPTAMQLRFTAVFGRTPGGPNTDELAAPFVMANNAPLTLYASNFSAPGPDGSWIYYLGAAEQNAIGQRANGQGPSNGRNCEYSFIVGITVIDSVQNWYTYGHDPGMDVKG